MKIVKWGAGLIALYLVVANATGSGSLLSSGSAGSVSLVKALQGR